MGTRLKRDNVAVTVRLSPETVKRLRALAKANHRTVAGQVSHWIDSAWNQRQLKTDGSGEDD